MTSVFEKDGQIVIKIERREDINLEYVYSPVFFSLLELNNKRHSIMHEDSDTEEDVETINTPTTDLLDNAKQGFATYITNPIGNLFGSSSKKGGGKKTKEAKETNYSKIAENVFSDTKQLATSAPKFFEGLLGLSDNTIQYTFVLRRGKSEIFQSNCETMKEFLIDMAEKEPSLFTFRDTGIRYNILEQIFNDIYLQLTYFRDINVKISEMRLENIFLVNGRFVLLDGEKMAEEKDEYFRINTLMRSLIDRVLGLDETVEEIRELNGLRLNHWLKKDVRLI